MLEPVGGPHLGYRHRLPLYKRDDLDQRHVVAYGRPGALTRPHPSALSPFMSSFSERRSFENLDSPTVPDCRGTETVMLGGAGCGLYGTLPLAARCIGLQACLTVRWAGMRRSGEDVARIEP